MQYVVNPLPLDGASNMTGKKGHSPGLSDGLGMSANGKAGLNLPAQWDSPSKAVCKPKDSFAAPMQVALYYLGRR